MSVRKRSSGFTLIELIVATVLSSVVLMGIFSLMTSIVSAEVDGMRTGTVTAWSIAGINAMNNDIPSGSYLAWPAAGASDDYLEICTNWSVDGAMMTMAGYAGNTVYYYCFDSPATGIAATSTDAPPSTNLILRKIVTNAVAACPGGSPAAQFGNACSAANYPNGIVATGVYRADVAGANSTPVFTAVQPASGSPNTVLLQMIVGNPNAGAAAGSRWNGSQWSGYAEVPRSIPLTVKIVLED